jgi:hypothetical protein
MRFISTLIYLLLALAARSQSFNDFVVLHNGDSLLGNINFTKQAVLVFDSLDNASSIPYNEVQSAKLGDKYGRLFYGRMLYYNDALEDDYVSKAMTDTALIAKLIYNSPKMNLYEAYDALNKIHYMVSKPQDTLLTLLIVNYAITASKGYISTPNYDKKRQIEIKYYINQLKQLFGDCEKLKWFYESLTYRSYSFKQIIKVYNKKCK